MDLDFLDDLMCKDLSHSFRPGREGEERNFCLSDEDVSGRVDGLEG